MKNKISVKYIALVGLFAALVAVGAFIKMPISIVPVTLQTFFVSLAGLLLGRKYGALSVVVYIILGLVGLPIFTQGGGPGYVFVPTFGYIIGFAIGAFVTGFLVDKVEKPTFLRCFLASLAGLVAVYGIGLVYMYFMRNFYLAEPMSLWNVLLYGFLLTIPGDIIFSVVASISATRLIPIIKR